MDTQPSFGSAGDRRVLVLGGGLAGIAAAIALGEQGYPVTLLERRGFLGGRAFSFPDPESGWEVDNGQHIFLGCCTAYIGLLRRLGVLHRTSVQDRLSLPVIANGRVGSLYSVSLPSPLHLLPAFLRYPHLGLREKGRLLYGMLHVARTDRREERATLEGETFQEWLRRHGQKERAMANFWNLLTLPALNSGAEAVSASMGLMVFQEGLLSDRHSANIGYARVGLTPLIQDAALDTLKAQGGEVRLHAPALALEVDNGTIAGVRTADGFLQADAYISALPFDVLLRLLPPSLAASPFFRPASTLRYGPIVGVHMWLDRPVTDLEMAAFLDSEVQWLFNKSRIQRRPTEEGQYLCISLSGAWRHIDLPHEELEHRFVQELRRLFPAARDAVVRRVLVVKQHQATFIPSPGSEAGRLPAVTPLPNLFLAGDWTDTGWPATMESAVRSGQIAASAAARPRSSGGV